MLHIDAHTDTYPDDGESKFTSGTTFTRAAEEDVVDAQNSIHLGARGAVALPGLFEYTRNWGYELIPGVELDSLGHTSGSRAYPPAARAVARSIFALTWTYSTRRSRREVATPTWGGLSAKERLDDPRRACRTRFCRLRRQHGQPAA